MKEAVFNLVLLCGERYRNGDKSLGWWWSEPVADNPWAPFRFFLGRAVYQGRSDDVSERVEERAVKTLEEFWSDEGLGLHRTSPASEKHFSRESVRAWQKRCATWISS